MTNLRQLVSLDILDELISCKCDAQAQINTRDNILLVEDFISEKEPEIIIHVCTFLIVNIFLTGTTVLFVINCIVITVTTCCGIPDYPSDLIRNVSNSNRH